MCDRIMKLLLYRQIAMRMFLSSIAVVVFVQQGNAQLDLNFERQSLNSARETFSQAQLTSPPSVVDQYRAGYEDDKFQYEIAVQCEKVRREEEAIERKRLEDEWRMNALMPPLSLSWRDSSGDLRYYVPRYVESPRMPTEEEIRMIHAAERERREREVAERKVREEYERARPSVVQITTIIPVPESRAPMPGSRIWTDHRGKQFSAKWVGISSDYARFVLVSDKTGKRVNAVYWKFSKQDQEYLTEEVNRYLSAGYVVHDGWWCNAVVAGRAHDVKNGGFPEMRYVPAPSTNTWERTKSEVLGNVNVGNSEFTTASPRSL